VLVVTPDDFRNRVWTLKAMTFDTLSGPRQNLNALVDTFQILVVDERKFQRQHLGQRADQFNFILMSSFH
jgi:hypothetical protein